MSDVILHHYPESPFAEKVRVAFGVKGLTWRSVIIPRIMPKPDLVPLTGGYRKTPVMQIGADIYCDTQCILREIERRFPEPSFYRGVDAGTANALSYWTDRNLFSPAVGIAFGRNGDSYGPEFLADRAKMSGREIDVARLKAAAPMFVDTLRPQFAWFDAMLADGRPFLQGQHPTLVDCSLYNPCWFIRRAAGVAPPLSEFPRLIAWMDRLASIGHGKPTELSSQDALAVAKNSTPEAKTLADPNDPYGRTPGLRVSVTPDDTGKDSVVGELISTSPYEVVLRRVDPNVGEVAVHFPRAGFVIKAEK